MSPSSNYERGFKLTKVMLGELLQVSSKCTKKEKKTESTDDDSASENESAEENSDVKDDSSIVDDEDEWTKFQQEAKKENILETKSKETHMVHCPHFPSVSLSFIDELSAICKANLPFTSTMSQRQ